MSTEMNRMPSSINDRAVEADELVRAKLLIESFLRKLGVSQSLRRGNPRVRQNAEDFLLQRLAQGEAPAREILAEATALGIAKRTLHRAKLRLGIRSKLRHPGGTLPAYWVWSLPASCQGGQGVMQNDDPLTP